MNIRAEFIDAIPGLVIYYNFVTPRFELILLSQIESRPWSTKLARFTQHYGFEYLYTRGTPVPTEPIPEGLLTKFRDYISERLNFDFNQIIINRYERNQGITGHIDSPRYFDKYVVSLSLGADCVMTFTKADQVVNLVLPRRSMVLLMGEARYEWQHSISNRITATADDGTVIKRDPDWCRISVTARRVMEG